LRWVVLLVAFLGACALAVEVNAADRPSAARCGGALWRLKTLSDPQRKTVNLTPRNTTIAAIIDRVGPSVAPTRRRTSFQRQNWEVVAQVVSFRREGTDVRLILFDHGQYMSAAIPSPSCLSATTRDRTSIAGAWNRFASGCGHATTDSQPLGAVAYVSGIGFWNGRGRGAAPNGAELHPVTGFRAVVGCGR